MKKLTRRSLLAALPAWAAGPRPRIRGLATQRHTINNRDYLFVEVETSDGITGLGEAAISGRIDIVEEAVRWFLPHLKDRDPAGID